MTTAITPTPILPTVEFYEWLTIDIETINGRPEDLERWFHRSWTPSASCKRAVTIGQRYLDKLQEHRERLALLDSSPILSIGLRSPQELGCLHCCYEHEPTTIAGGSVQGFADGRQMLMVLRNLIEGRVAIDTVLVGHNLAHFDLPKLRWAFLRCKLRPPRALIAGDQPIFDTMTEYGRRYSIKQDKFVALADLLEEFGLPAHKDLVDGAMVPELYENGEHDTIIRYTLLDVLSESELFLRMTGQIEDGRCVDEPTESPSEASGDVSSGDDLHAGAGTLGDDRAGHGTDETPAEQPAGDDGAQHAAEHAADDPFNL